MSKNRHKLRFLITGYTKRVQWCCVFCVIILLFLQSGFFMNDSYDSDSHQYDEGQKELREQPLALKEAYLMNNSDLSKANASFIGEEIGDTSGYSVAGAGDVNNDGYDDILIGAWQNDDGGSLAGKSYLIFGNENDYLSKEMDLANANASFIGEEIADLSGSSVAGAGDVNNDGYDDILIGAQYNDDGGSDAGKTYLIFGNTTDRFSMGMSLSNANASFIGEEIGDISGSSVAGAGDVNNDGYDDILIGAQDNDDGGNNAGKTYLIFGNTSESFSKEIELSSVSASFIGYEQLSVSHRSVAGACDVNNDGYDDILIGAYDFSYSKGITYLIFGNEASYFSMNMRLSNANASFLGENEGDYSGYSVAGTGDVNNDGYDDILIGAPYHNDGESYAGKTYLIFGNTTDRFSMGMSLSNANASFIGEGLNDYSGYSVAGTGDVNNDGYDDILIGAYKNDEGGTDAGQSYLIYGDDTNIFSSNMSLSNANASFIGEEIGDISGSSVAGAGDVNNDGYDDILIGAKDNDDGGNFAGKTYFILGTGGISFNIETNTTIPDRDGYFWLNWSNSLMADNYSLYWSSKPGVYQRDILYADGLTNNSIYITEFEAGTYYFRMASYNTTHTLWSNEISIHIEIPWGQLGVISSGGKSIDYGHSITADKDGNIFVVWSDESDYGEGNTNWDVFCRRWDAIDLTWGNPQLVSDVGEIAAAYPSIAMDNNSNLHVLWSDFSDYNGAGEGFPDIFYRNWNCLTGTWSTTEVVSSESDARAELSSIAADNEGNVYAVWQDQTNYSGCLSESESTDILYRERDISTGLWSDIEVISTVSTKASKSPSIAVDKEGNVHIVWWDGTDYAGSGSDYDIFYTFKKVESSSWNTTTVVSKESTGTVSEPSITTDKDGNVHIAWEDKTGASIGSNIFYTYWNASSKTWNDTMSISIDSAVYSEYPCVKADSRGNIHFSWEDEVMYGKPDAKKDIFYRCLNMTDKSWSTTEIVSIECINDSETVEMAIDPYDMIHFIWNDKTNYEGCGNDQDLFYKRLGTTEETPEGTCESLKNGETYQSKELEIAVRVRVPLYGVQWVVAEIDGKENITLLRVANIPVFRCASYEFETEGNHTIKIYVKTTQGKILLLDQLSITIELEEESSANSPKEPSLDWLFPLIILIIIAGGIAGMVYAYSVYNKSADVSERRSVLPKRNKKVTDFLGMVKQLMNEGKDALNEANLEGGLTAYEKIQTLIKQKLEEDYK